MNPNNFLGYKWGLLFFLSLFICTIRVYAQGLRIVSLAPNTTEIIFALGLGNCLVGVDSFSDFPESAKSIEKVGTFSQPNIEKIVSLKPNLIFTTGLEQNPAVSRLEQIGFRTVTVDPRNIQELFQDILKIGEITHHKKEAEELILKIKQDLSKIQKKLENISYLKRLKVYLEIWPNPLMTCGKDSYIDEMISLAGGINIARDIRRRFSRISQEVIFKKSPDIIILAYMQNGEKAKKIVSQRYGWKVINGVKNNRIYADINPDIILRPGPRIIEGIKELYKRFYGEEID